MGVLHIIWTFNIKDILYFMVDYLILNKLVKIDYTYSFPPFYST